MTSPDNEKEKELSDKLEDSTKQHDRLKEIRKMTDMEFLRMYAHNTDSALQGETPEVIDFVHKKLNILSDYKDEW